MSSCFIGSGLGAACGAALDGLGLGRVPAPPGLVVCASAGAPRSASAAAARNKFLRIGDLISDYTCRINNQWRSVIPFFALYHRSKKRRSIGGRAPGAKGV